MDEPEVKKCKRCGGTARYAHRHCKTCKDRQTAKYRAENPMKYKGLASAWYFKNAEKILEARKTTEARKRARKSTRQWEKNHPESKRAHDLVRYALRAGRLTKSACEVCGSLTAEAHHDDYSKPLDVRWLCKKHHHEHHRTHRAEILISPIKV